MKKTWSQGDGRVPWGVLLRGLRPASLDSFLVQPTTEALKQPVPFFPLGSRGLSLNSSHPGYLAPAGATGRGSAGQRSHSCGSVHANSCLGTAQCPLHLGHLPSLFTTDPPKPRDIEAQSLTTW